MAAENLIVDDEYLQSMSDHIGGQGEKINSAINEYINILKEVREISVLSGDLSEAWDMYISHAEMLSGEIGEITQLTQNQLGNFITRINEADTYVF